MADSAKARVFGLDGDSSDTEDLYTGDNEAPQFNFSKVNLDLDDSALDAEADSQTYKPIPQWTRTDFTVIAARPGTTRGGDPRLSVDFEVVSEEWGRRKKINYQDFVISDSQSFKWLPFLYSTGLIESASQVTETFLTDLFAHPQKLEGRTVSAQVLGYTWKKRPGTMDPDFPSSYGKDAQPVPTDGTPYYEDLGKWTRPVPEADTKPREDMSTLAEFASQSLADFT